MSGFVVTSEVTGNTLGTIKVVGGKLVGSNEGVQSIADGALNRNRQNLALAVKDLSDYSNGYVTSKRDTSE